MKGTLGNPGDRGRLRNALVVGQFTVTAVLVVGAMVIYQQLAFIQTAETGMEREQVVVVELQDRGLRPSFEALKQQWQAHAGVLGVTASVHRPTLINSSQGTRRWEGRENEGTNMVFYNTHVHYEYLDVLGLELVEGQGFTEANVDDTTQAVIINETMRDQLGWTTAVGKWVRRPSWRVVGVVRDFNFHGLQQVIQPLEIRLNTNVFAHLLVKVRPDDLPETLAYLESTYASFGSAYPFEYTFLDDAFQAMYETEVRLGRLFSAFTVLALLIACLGLIGLAAFMAARRTKEIGVRKVLGASVGDVVVLLSKDFTRLVLVALAVGLPVAYYLATLWLHDFAYRITFGWPLFVGAAVLMVFMAWSTVSYQALRAAWSNPVDALRQD